jgi:glutamate-5-semialdehyde dehydrogenase
MDPTVIDLHTLGRNAKIAAKRMALATSTQKNKALELIAKSLETQKSQILAANLLDIEQGKSNALSPAMLDRLSLQGRLSGIAEDIKSLMHLPDPVGEIFEDNILANGLRTAKQRVPIGVLGVIYEARPNVTLDVSALSIKTGNCALLRGGSETLNSNRLLVKIIRDALQQAGLPADAIQFIDSPDRNYVKELLTLHDFVDLIIPRGGASLHQFCRENSSIPVITGGIGICHLFVDANVNQEKALEVIHNAKTQRPTVCNALDTVLVHEAIAQEFIPKLLHRLAPAGVIFKVDSPTFDMLNKQGMPQNANWQLANDQTDWSTEWLSLTIGIKMVSSLEQAMDHIQKYSSGHSDGILTENSAHADIFTRNIDSAAVYVNASTRFTDGGQLGLGAEVAVSTQKLHARGPMGLRELTSYKWVIRGDYHVRK